MEPKESIVRIIKASETPYLPEGKVITLPVRTGSRFHLFFNAAVLIAIVFLTIFISANLINFGISARELVILIGIPVALGVFTRSVI